MKILLFDIENAPSKAYIWQSKTYFIPEPMIFDEWYMLCWSAKWLNDDYIYSCALCDSPNYKKNLNNDFYVVKELWNLLDKADIVVAHNGINFDVKKANARFIFHNMKPPSPFKTVDTLKICRRKFKFTSNKLDYISKRLGIGRKKENAGIILWEKCMSGDKKAWKEMIEYCENDVVLLEKIYKRFLPYINNHPNTNVYNGTIDNCPKCGSVNIHKRGFTATIFGKKQRYQCQDCGGWGTSGRVIKNA